MLYIANFNTSAILLSMYYSISNVYILAISYHPTTNPLKPKPVNNLAFLSIFLRCNVILIHDTIM